ncbi:MAG: hypothetical protein RLZZ450_5429 [Pseudomonadota bacterium]|jgi:hypothetical protein
MKTPALIAMSAPVCAMYADRSVYGCRQRAARFVRVKGL